MAVQIYISHTGQSLPFDEKDERLEVLRPWIERHAGIPANRQILMSGRGKNVKNLSNETEIFVYDKQSLSSSSKPPSDRSERIPDLSDPPSSPSNENDLQSWQELFMSQRSWALEAVEAVRSGVETAESCQSETDVIARSIGAALDNLKNHVTNLSQKFDKTEEWALGRLQEHKEALTDLDSSLKALSELPVREDVAHILRKASESRQANTLLDLVVVDGVRDAESSLRSISREFEGQLTELQKSMKNLKGDSAQVDQYDLQAPDVDTGALLDEAETLAKRISNDYEDVLKLPDSTKSVSTASKKATTHARDFLPTFQSIMDDLKHALKICQDGRNEAARKLYATLQEISRIQSRLATLQTGISGLDLPDDNILPTLLRVFDLPTVYGCTLIEAIRRSEWTQGMQKEVDSLHDDLSQLKEEEHRRRKKWASLYSQFLNDDLNANDALIDIKTSKPRNAWPFVNRDEVFAWVDDLRALGIDDAVREITQRLKELDAPVRKPRPKTFKNGSVHDLSQSSTMPNADEIRALQDDKLRLEDRLRTSDSRVRKLEDLLHRQSQLSRPQSGSFVPGGASDFERQATSPNPLMRPSDDSRRSSVSQRRFSNTPDEKSMAHRIVSLEAEIHKLQDEAHAERRSSTENRDKMQEAESVKQDLMANFEAQRQEFEDERLLLDDENRKLRVRLEELEDELDGVVGSRDHLRQTQDQVLSNLRNEIDQLRKTSAEELAQAQRKGEDHRKDVVTQRDRASTLERQLQQVREERAAAQNQNMSLARQLRSYEEQQQDLISILQSAHANLSPAGSPPEEMRRLVNALEILSEGAAIHARGLDDSLQLATAENRSLEEKLAHTESQIKNLNARLASAESKSSSVSETLEHERSKLAAVRAELSEEQEQSNNLRAKFAAGETGSDALRERLNGEERKVADLLETKIENEGVIQSLKNEIENLTSDSKADSDRLQKLQAHLDRRGEKARQLSEKLFQHNDRIIRMLEQFGYSITRQDETLVIQRASKANASTLLSGGEGSSSMRRTVSGGGPSQHYSDPSDLDTLYWTSDAEVANEDNKYHSFLGALQRLDLDATIDIVTKRYKDVENLAKKYQKDSRAYREKSHRLQSEAHEKIAYRSFKEGDLALFLPTRNQATRPWAAFNVGAPHYFLREQDVHKLQSRDWLLARISKVEERVVDLSRSLSGARGTASINTELSDAASARSVDDENPYELSDGLRWYMIDASEEKPGAPGTPSVGKSTVTASNIDVKGQLGRGSSTKDNRSSSIMGGGGAASGPLQATKNLTKSLDSRRSSSGSKKSVNANANAKAKGDAASAKDPSSPRAPMASDAAGQQTVKPSAADPGPGQPAREDARVFEVDEDGGYHARYDASARGRTASPIKSHSKSASASASPAKGKGSAKVWDRLFSVEYNG